MAFIVTAGALAMQYAGSHLFSTHYFTLTISAAHVTACARGSHVVKCFNNINHAVQTSQADRSAADLRQSHDHEGSARVMVHVADGPR